MRAIGFVVVGLAVLGCGGRRVASPAMSPPPSTAARPRYNLKRAIELAARAHQLVLAKRSQEARAAVGEALPLLEPGNVEHDARAFQLHMIEGESYRYENRPELAVVPFETAIGVAFRHEREHARRILEASARLADLHQRRKRHDQALTVLERALPVGLKDPTLADQTQQLVAMLVDSYRSLSRDDRATALVAAHGISKEITFAATVPPEPPSQAAGERDAQQIVAAMQPDFRACYQQTLSTLFWTHGTLRLTLHVASDGHVERSTVDGWGIGSAAVDCILQRTLAARFAAPEGGAAVIRVPVRFVRSIE